MASASAFYFTSPSDNETNSMFNQQVRILLGGLNSPVNLEELRKYTSYGGLYDDGEANFGL